MIRQFVLMFALLFAGAVCADDFVTTVTARQVQPWNGLVEIAVGLFCESNELIKVGCTFAATNSATRAALPVSHVRQVGGDTGSGTSWTRHFIWDATSDLGEVKVDDVSLTADTMIICEQLWENGPYWATCNVGAAKPEECGYYFRWGDTVGYKRNASNNGWISVNDSTSFSFSSGDCPTYGKNNSQLQSAGYIDASGNLVAAHDAATAHLGAPWRMPTDAEFSALINNCDTEWTSRNGVPGQLVKGRGAYASKSIFLPAAGCGNDSYLNWLGADGYYWSSTPNSDSSSSALFLYSCSGFFYWWVGSRSCGRSVRPVRGFAK